MRSDYRKIVVEVCRMDLDCLGAVVREAVCRAQALDGVTSSEILRTEVAAGIVDLLRDAYKATVEDGHDQVEAHEYAEAERAFLGGPREERSFKRVGNGTVCAIHVDGDDRNDFYLYCDPVRIHDWRDIPDLIGRAAYRSEE